MLNRQLLRYKRIRSLLTTMLSSEYRLSSTWFYHSKECWCLKSLFSRLKYPQHIINSTSNTFVSSRVADPQPSQASAEMTSCDSGSLIPFKEQNSANLVKTQLKDLSLKLHTAIQLVFVSKKIGQDLHECETKPQVVNLQCVVYHFQCNLQVYVIQVAMLVIRVDILATKINDLPCAHNKIKPTGMPSLRTFSVL